MPEQRRVTGRTFCFQRLIPCHKLTGREGITRIIYISACGFLFDDLRPAGRTGCTGILCDCLGIGTLRKARTGQEFTETAYFNHHITAALFTDNIRNLVLNLNALLIEILFGLLKRTLKITVKIMQQLDIIQPARFDFIELMLHIGREFIVGNRCEFINQQPGHTLTEWGRPQAFILLDHIGTVNNGRNRRCIG